MLQNAYLLAKIGADTAENERNFAEISPKIGNYPTGRKHAAQVRRGVPGRGGPPKSRGIRCFPPVFLLFENSKAIADFDTKAVSKIDQTWRILARRRSVKSISWNDSPQGQPADPLSTGAHDSPPENRGPPSLFPARPPRRK